MHDVQCQAEDSGSEAGDQFKVLWLLPGKRDKEGIIPKTPLAFLLAAKQAMLCKMLGRKPFTVKGQR